MSQPAWKLVSPPPLLLRPREDRAGMRQPQNAAGRHAQHGRITPVQTAHATPNRPCNRATQAIEEKKRAKRLAEEQSAANDVSAPRLGRPAVPLLQPAPPCALGRRGLTATADEQVCRAAAVEA